MVWGTDTIGKTKIVLELSTIRALSRGTSIGLAQELGAADCRLDQQRTLRSLRKTPLLQGRSCSSTHLTKHLVGTLQKVSSLQAGQYKGNDSGGYIGDMNQIL